MRTIPRVAGPLLAVVLLLALQATAAIAGSWAEVTIIEGGEAPPTAGEERELRLSVLQHGVTPVEAGTLTVTAVLPGTGEMVTADAMHVGGGEWVATLTLPSGGDWQLRAIHNVFETPAATTFTVAGGPDIGSMAATAAIAGAALLGLALVLVARTLARGRAGKAAAGEPVRAS